jgi:hypothetical protein
LSFLVASVARSEWALRPLVLGSLKCASSVCARCDKPYSAVRRESKQRTIGTGMVLAQPRIVDSCIVSSSARPGRSLLAPEATSVKTFLHPAFFSASRCRSRRWSGVDTRA